MKTLFLILFFLLPRLAFAAPTHDATSTFLDNNSTSVSGSHTRGGACTNPVAIISVGWQASTTTALSTVSYGGNAATFQGGVDLIGGGLRVELWTYKNPASGAATVTATFAAMVNYSEERVSTYCDVDQTTTFGTLVSGTGSSTTATVDATSAANELVVDAVLTGGTATITVGAGQTQRANFGAYLHGASDEAGAATVTMSWTLNVGDYWGILALPLHPVAAAGGATRRKIIISM